MLKTYLKMTKALARLPLTHGDLFQLFSAFNDNQGVHTKPVQSILFDHPFDVKLFNLN